MKKVINNLDMLQSDIVNGAIDICTFDVSFCDAENEKYKVLFSNGLAFICSSNLRYKRTTNAKVKIMKMLSVGVSDCFYLNSKLTKYDFNKEFYDFSTLSIDDYILIHHDNNNSTFGRINGVRKQNVNIWKVKKYIVVDGVLYSPRRTLSTKIKPLFMRYGS